MTLTAAAPLFSVPTPFNTLSWRVVVLTEDGYLEGFASLVADDRPIRFTAYLSDKQSLEAAAGIWAVERLRWFTQDFVTARVDDDILVLSDLRMGQEPLYLFNHAVARRGNPDWHEMEPRLLPVSVDSGVLDTIWQRMWRTH